MKMIIIAFKFLSVLHHAVQSVLLAFSVLAIMATASHAQSESDLEQPSGNQLPTITTRAETDEKPQVRSRCRRNAAHQRE